MNSLPKTVTRQRRGCDLNPGPSAPGSSTLTTRLLLVAGMQESARAVVVGQQHSADRYGHVRWTVESAQTRPRPQPHIDAVERRLHAPLRTRGRAPRRKPHRRNTRRHFHTCEKSQGNSFCYNRCVFILAIKGHSPSHRLHSP